jgi:hypothetical protein
VATDQRCARPRTDRIADARPGTRHGGTRNGPLLNRVLPV